MKKTMTCLLREEDNYKCNQTICSQKCKGCQFFDETPVVWLILGRLTVWVIIPLIVLSVMIYFVVSL